VANVPTGTHLMCELMGRLFSDALNLPLREIDTGDPLWVERMRRTSPPAARFHLARPPSSASLVITDMDPEHAVRCDDQGFTPESTMRRPECGLGGLR
jgi:hypothetical protein